MFTGIVEELGTVISLKRGSKAAVLTIKANVIFEDLKLGDSVAVNGVCLTVTQLKSDRFVADVMPETVHRSSLGALKFKKGICRQLRASDGSQWKVRRSYGSRPCGRYRGTC